MQYDALLQSSVTFSQALGLFKKVKRLGDVFLARRGERIKVAGGGGAERVLP
jgi:hypothetical protein